VVSACSEALILDTRMDGSVASERAESYATQDGEVLGTVCFAQTAPIFAEGDVQDSVEGIFNPPVGASRMEQLLSVAMGFFLPNTRKSGDVLPRINSGASSSGCPQVCPALRFVDSVPSHVE
jgi:hypothetical protein